MKQQGAMRNLHMGCGESLAVSQMTRVSSSSRATTATQKPAKSKQIKRRPGNEGDR